MGSRAISNDSMWSLLCDGRKTFASLLVGEGATI